MKHFSAKDLRELSTQLRCPFGAAGIELAENLNETNASMIDEALKALELEEGQRVLEIGPGNGAHISSVLELYHGLYYTGLDISADMIRECERINEIWISRGNARFMLYDGFSIDQGLGKFDRIFTVNTLYFWLEPIRYLTRLSELLSADGHLVICFGQKDYMENLPFVGAEFKLYNTHEFLKLIHDSPFEIEKISHYKEMTRSKTGDIVERHFSVAKCMK